MVEIPVKGHLGRKANLHIEPVGEWALIAYEEFDDEGKRRTFIAQLDKKGVEKLKKVL